MSETTLQPESAWPHRLALAMVCVTFPLIWVGGLVTTHQAGMAVPDWPNTYGYNLFLYPLSTWLAGPFDLLIEHGHRLLGALVGMLAIAFVVSVYVSDRRPWMRRLAIVALVGVCLQGSLGGLRVVLDARTLAMIHGCVGPAFFALTMALVAVTSRGWRSAEPRAADPLAGRVQRLALFTVLLAYVQLVLGAQLRHTPIDAGPGFFRAAVYFHLLVALAILVHAGLLGLAVVRLGDARPRVSGPAVILFALVLLQIALGGATWVSKYGFPQWLGEHVWTAEYVVQREAFVSSLIVTGHVAVGSLILATALLVVLRSFRFLQSETLLAAREPRHRLKVAL